MRLNADQGIDLQGSNNVRNRLTLCFRDKKGRQDQQECKEFVHTMN